MLRSRTSLVSSFSVDTFDAVVHSDIEEDLSMEDVRIHSLDPLYPLVAGDLSES